jgi:8-oxo-dGTP pyrophosphatase MutT (NUDIX family)
MNRRIYFQDKYLEFAEDALQNSKDQSLKVNVRDTPGALDLKDVAKELCAGDRYRVIRMKGYDFEATFEKLKKHFHYIEAAGGFIEHVSKWLFIRRHDRWDLPKGKLEKGESKTHGAVRECEEECGVKNLRIIRELSPTYHIYPYKGEFALKQTFWFYMHTEFGGELVPQLEEHITEVRWFTKKEILSEALKDTYYTISDVVREGLG